MRAPVTATCVEHEQGQTHPSPAPHFFTAFLEKTISRESKTKQRATLYPHIGLLGGEVPGNRPPSASESPYPHLLGAPLPTLVTGSIADIVQPVPLQTERLPGGGCNPCKGEKGRMRRVRGLSPSPTNNHNQ